MMEMTEEKTPSIAPKLVIGLGTMTVGALMLAAMIPTPIWSLPYALLGSGFGALIAKPRRRAALAR
jgi:hypothetical protein